MGPDAVPAAGFRPHFRVIRVQMLPDDFVVIILQAQSGLVRDGDETVIHNFIRRADDVGKADVGDFQLAGGGTTVKGTDGRAFSSPQQPQNSFVIS